MTYRCIRPHCSESCSQCNRAIPETDTTGVLVADLLNALDDGYGYEDGESKLVDRARAWLDGRSAELIAARPVVLNPGEVFVPFDTPEGAFLARMAETMRNAPMVLTVTAPGHLFKVGDIVTNTKRKRWTRLKMLFTRPRLDVITSATADTFVMEGRRPTWKQWRRELVDVLFGWMR